MIDTHAHIMLFNRGENKSKELKAILLRARVAGIDRIVNVGCDIKSSCESIAMAKEYDGLYATLGLHPYDALEVTDELMGEWEELIKGNKKVIAIGECGLDYFKGKVAPADQKQGFRKQLELASRMDLPVIVHNRNADEDCLEVLKEFSGVRVVFHCYGSNLEFARKVWAEGYLTSFTGIITYPNAEELREVVREVPEDLFMVETDCPFLAPQKYRGQRNEPAYVVEVAREIARVKGLSFEEVSRISTENAEKFFGI